MVYKYVIHVCKKCDCAFIAEDYTHVQVDPPHWRYCPECANKLGINYKKQKPWDNLTEAKKNQLEKLKRQLKSS